MNSYAVAILIVIAIVLTILLKIISEKLYKPQLPDGYDENDILLISTCRTYFCSACFVGGIIIGGLIAFSLLKVMLSGEGDMMEMLGALVLIVGTVVGLVLFVYFVMKNYSVILLKDGIIYRAINGQTYVFKDAEVKGYIRTSAPKRHYVRVITTGQSVWISSMATNYYKAIDIIKKYPNL